MTQLRTTILAAFVCAGLGFVASRDHTSSGRASDWAAFENDPTDRKAAVAILRAFPPDETETAEEEVFVKRALETLPDEVALLDHLAYAIYFPQRRYKEALVDFTALSQRLNDRNAAVARILHDVNLQIGDDESALRYARIAAANDPHPRHEIMASRLETDMGQPDDALESLTRAAAKLEQLRPSLSRREAVEIDFDIEREHARIAFESGNVKDAVAAVDELDRELTTLRATSTPDLHPVYDRIGAENARLRTLLAH